MTSDDIVKVWTDGSSKKRPDNTGFDGAWAFVAIHGERRMEKYCGGYAKQGTIGAMELYAIYASLAIIKPTGRRLSIYSDSDYSVKALTLWHKAWIRQGWITAMGKPIRHRPLLEATLDELKRHRETGSLVEIIHIRGHKGVPENERADFLAGQARLTGESNVKGVLLRPWGGVTV